MQIETQGQLASEIMATVHKIMFSAEANQSTLLVRSAVRGTSPNQLLSAAITRRISGIVKGFLPADPPLSLRCAGLRDRILQVLEMFDEEESRIRTHAAESGSSYIKYVSLGMTMVVTRALLEESK